MGHEICPSMVSCPESRHPESEIPGGQEESVGNLCSNRCRQSCHVCCNLALGLWPGILNFNLNQICHDHPACHRRLWVTIVVLIFLLGCASFGRTTCRRKKNHAGSDYKAGSKFLSEQSSRGGGVAPAVHRLLAGSF
jgi:hypothetical protein